MQESKAAALPGNSLLALSEPGLLTIDVTEAIFTAWGSIFFKGHPSESAGGVERVESTDCCTRRDELEGRRR